jgi:hypothetical protein
MKMRNPTQRVLRFCSRKKAISLVLEPRKLHPPSSGLYFYYGSKYKHPAGSVKQLSSVE